MTRDRTTTQRPRRRAGRIAAIAATIAAMSAVTAAIRLAARHGRHHRAQGYSMNRSPTDVGPVDLAVIKFVGNDFTGEVTPALLDLVRTGTVRILDALFVYRGVDGDIGSIEIGDLGPDLQPAFVSVDGGAGVGLLDAEDVVEVGGGLIPGTSALLLVFENTWAARFAGAAARAGGELMDIARVPSQAVAQALAPLAAG
jgi:hypothetical protein